VACNSSRVYKRQKNTSTVLLIAIEKRKALRDRQSDTQNYYFKLFRTTTKKSPAYYDIILKFRRRIPH